MLRHAVAFAAASNGPDQGKVESARAALRDGEGAVQEVRVRARDLVRKTTGDATFTDVNYIVPSFILTHVPVGLVGLLIVAVILAATDTIAGELNSLSTATVIDFYRRWVTPSASDAHYLMVSKLATGGWGLFACGVAVWAAELGSLIEVVNRFGSFFYGSVLGVFILALAVPWATGAGAFVGLAAGMGAVAWFAAYSSVAFLWHNVIGAVTVVVVDQHGETGPVTGHGPLQHLPVTTRVAHSQDRLATDHRLDVHDLWLALVDVTAELGGTNQEGTTAIVTLELVSDL